MCIQETVQTRKKAGYSRHIGYVQASTQLGRFSAYICVKAKVRPEVCQQGVTLEGGSSKSHRRYTTEDLLSRKYKNTHPTLH